MIRLYSSTVLLLLIFLFLTSYPADVSAQETVTVARKDISLRIGGTIQPRFTYAEEKDFSNEFDKTGFGIRRFRLRTYFGIGSQLSLFAQAEGATTSVQMLDLRLDYQFAPDLRVRVGRFVGAQPRGMAMTLHSEIDAVDRATIADLWARNTIGADARDYGLELVYRPEKVEYRLFVHNGDNRLNFRYGVADENILQGDSRTQMAIGSMVRYFPNDDAYTDLGIYAGYNASGGTRSSVVNSSMTLAVHAYRGTYAGHFPWRIKFDAIMTRYNVNPELILTGDQLFAGGNVFGGVLLRRDTELFAKAEYYTLDALANDPDWSIIGATGLTYSASAFRGRDFLAHKITIAYTYRHLKHLGRTNNLLQVQVQILI